MRSGFDSPQVHVDYMDRTWFEDRWRALVASGHTDAEAFEMLERANPVKAAAFMEWKVEELLGQLLQSDDGLSPV